MAYHYQQGIYQLQHPEKYLGKSNPRYLSGYEFHMFRYLDHHRDILRWGAEIIVVPYYNPIKARKARYIVDVYVERRARDGKVHKELIEIKPAAQVRKPAKRGRKKQATFAQEELTYAVNRAKWEAANEFAKQRGWVFRVMTENSIYGHHN